MRALGYRVVDRVVDHYAHRAERSIRSDDASALPGLQGESLPEEGRPVEEVLARIEDEVLGNLIHVDHPRFFAFVPSPSNYLGFLGDALASGLNVFAGNWLEAAGPAAVEVATVEWIRERCGLPAGAGGLFVSGGSAANLTGLFTARQIRLGESAGRATAYASDQVHSSLDRTLRLIGLPAGRFRRLECDARFRLDLERLRRSVAADREDGLEPWAVIANAGATNTGAVDPLPELAAFCREEGLWLHVDGAYGGAAVFSDRARRLLTGIGEADSVSLDPHKWLFQPFEIGCALVRDVSHLHRAFNVSADYLVDIAAEGAEVNFCDRGFQLTRSFRALKLWTTLQVHGRREIERAIDHGLDIARHTAELVDRSSGWETIGESDLGIVALRFVDAPAGELDRINRDLVRRSLEDGLCMVSSTTLRGHVWLRMCPLHPGTTREDVRRSLDRLDQLARTARDA